MELQHLTVYLRKARMSGERKNRWLRVKNPEPLSLQARDKEIVGAVYECGFLTREQIQRLFAINSTARANIRLRKLFDHGYLIRRFLPTTRGAAKAVYFLGHQGIHLVSDKKGYDPLEIKRRQKVYREKKELFFDHDLAVNEVRIAFYQAMNQQNDLTLDRWLSSADCLQEYEIADVRQKRVLKVFRPDGYLRYFYEGKLFSCFLEVDRSTMSNTRFRAKVKTYLEYARSGLYQQRYGLKFFRVLVITKTGARLISLKRVTASLTNKMFWFTTMEHVTPDEAFNQIWERPGSEEKVSLLR
jgi:hypothetical protein